MHEKCLEYTFGITVELNKQNLGLPLLSLVICVIILPAQQFLFPSTLNEERLKFVVLITRSFCYSLIISHVSWLTQCC